VHSAVARLRRFQRHRLSVQGQRADCTSEWKEQESARGRHPEKIARECVASRYRRSTPGKIVLYSYRVVL
jgi:hypothetical protein